jgi:hypothetical protein
MPASDLHDLLPLWERKLPHRLYETEPDRLLRRDVDLAVPPGREHVVRNGGILTQDIVRAIIVSQRRVER